MDLFRFTLFTLFTMLNGPAFAQELKVCSVKNFAKVYMDADKAPDDIKELAIAELKIARAKIAEDDEEACSAHLTSAYEIVAAN